MIGVAEVNDNAGAPMALWGVSIDACSFPPIRCCAMNMFAGGMPSVIIPGIPNPLFGALKGFTE